jgi:hypothetical protein
MSTGTTAATIERAEVEACKIMEAAPTTAYLEARQCIPALSRRYADSEDVAAVAYVLLASAMVSEDGYKCAAYAVRRAASRMSEQHARHAAEVPAGDTMGEAAECEDVAARTLYARPIPYSSPDARYGWTRRDALATAASLMDEDGAALLAALWDAPDEVWDVRGVRGVSVARLASLITGQEVKRGRVTTAYAAALTAALEDVTAALEAAGWQGHGLDSASSGHERQVPKYADNVAGPASMVVRTRPDGSHWVTYPTHSAMVTPDTAATVLALPSLPARPQDGRVREVTTAALSAPRDLMPARRPAGVGIGLVHGNGQRAGGGAPEPRPTMSRRRKRDGGIGSPMVPA